ncbi:unnamed protein product [Paramecium primaurelia]|uniref:Protein kinase domain-containing protein n=1 Tax=Paramecium primaurelia TaxID=5886 RepID=A0A8S1QN53_PARPR|nr:unnamed protein product [Paramecium primaurelia]
MIKDKSPIQKGNYIILRDKLIGKGRHSFIYDCINELDKQTPFCAKIFFNTTIPRTLQFDKLKNINNTNLLKYYEIFEHNKDVIIIMEKCDCNLKNIIDKQPLSELDTYQLLRQFLSGYQTLIDVDLDLRELKPANILVKNNVYKISNYGISSLYKVVEGETKPFSAPEIFYEKEQTRIKDIFSLGLVLYFGFYNQLPYTYRSAVDQVAFFRQIKSINFEIKKEIPLNLKQLLQSMIIYDPSQRIKIEELQLQFNIENKVI